MFGDVLCVKLLSMKGLKMAEYRGRKVTLNKPFRLSTAESKRKKFGVYVKNKSTGRIKKVTYFFRK